jgi:hypothetical protein
MPWKLAAVGDTHGRVGPSPSVFLIALLACLSRLGGIDANGQFLVPICVSSPAVEWHPMFLATAPTPSIGREPQPGLKMPIRATALPTFVFSFL